MEKIESIKELRKKCQPNAEASLFIDKIYRKISIYVTKLFLYTPITANQVTFLMMLVGILSAVFYIKGEYFYSLFAIFLFHIYILLDFVDGEVAKYRKQFTRRGAYLDLMSHIIINPLLIMGMAIGSYNNNPFPIPDSAFIVAGFIGAYSLLMLNFMSLKKYEMYVKENDFSILKKAGKVFYERDRNDKWDIKKSLFSRFKSQISSLAGFRHFNLMFYFTIFNLVPLLVLFNAVLFGFSALIKFYRSYKHIDELY